MNILESLLLLVFRHFSDIPAYLIEIWSVSLTLRFTLTRATDQRINQRTEGRTKPLILLRAHN